METLQELARLILIGALGGTMTFFIQPSLLERSPNAGQEAFQTWLAGNYRIGAGAVYFVSLVVSIAWYYIAFHARIRTPRDPSNLSIIWWGLLLLPILSMGGALNFFGGKPEWQILPALAGFYVLNVLIVYWLATALSTPRLLKYVVPGAFFIRRLFRF